MPAVLAPALLLAATLAFVVRAAVTGRSAATRLIGWWRPTTRRHVLAASAAATFVVFGVSTLAGLALLGRLAAIGVVPDELRPAAWAVGASGEPSVAAAIDIGGPLALGMAIGVAILAWRGWRGKKPIGLAYRSPVAARDAGERPPAALIALAAGVGEELFFRLWIPLLVALLFGAPVAGFAVGLVAFTALHRHQGWVGMTAVALVGAGLAWVYLATGLLWFAMLLHVLVDLNALVLRPLLSPGCTPSPSR